MSVTSCNTTCDDVTTPYPCTLPICGLHNTLRKILLVKIVVRDWILGKYEDVQDRALIISVGIGNPRRSEAGY